MKQVLQNLKSGELKVEEVPEPTLSAGRLLIANRASVISAGTERSTVSVARKSLVGKALERPEQVRKVLAVARREGLKATANLVRSRLDTPSALGYSSAGEVLEVGAGVSGFAVGDRVACAGQDYASHAERVCVPSNLCVPMPGDVAFEDAAYVALGAIALQAVRQAEPQIGDRVAVIGLGLVGLIAAQILRANGCRVLASDPDAERRTLAGELGIGESFAPAELARAVAAGTDDRGVDRVIIAASTDSDEPVRAAAEISRLRGRVVVVGAVGMDLPRELYYQKELDLRLSRSYGPGRYDPAYEEKGRDYPYEYVRWTEGRNMKAFLELISAGRLDIGRLTSHRFDITDAEAAYDLVMEGTEPFLGVVLAYPQSGSVEATGSRIELAEVPFAGEVRWGVVGAGQHVKDRLLPVLASQAESSIRIVCTERGGRARRLAEKLGAAACTTDAAEVFDDEAVNAVLIGTRHHLHADQVLAALAAGKHVFVEKPLCLDLEELEAITEAYAAASADGQRLMVGFNRRFSSHVERAREFLASRSGPLTMIYRVNAGSVPADHWTRDPEVGGGRIPGELGHFIDTLQAVAGAGPTSVRGVAPGFEASLDQGAFLLTFADGSIGTIVYSAAGDARLPKERFEALGGGDAVVIDDFKRTIFYRAGAEKSYRSRGQDKGFKAELNAFCREIVEGGSPAMPFEEIAAASRSTLLAGRSVATGLVETL